MKIKKIIAMSLSALIGSAIGVAGVIDSRAESDWTLNEIEYKSNYVVGETLDLVTGEFIRGDEKVRVSPIVYFPSGKAYKSDGVVLNEAGNYRIDYATSINGKTVSESKRFVVNDMQYGMSSSRSSAEYGHSPYTVEGSANGLVVSLAQGDTFRYNTALNLKELTKDDDLLQFYITPETKYVAEAFVINVRLVDAYDPSNYIWIRSYAQTSSSWESWSSMYLFQTACVPSIGQNLMGWFYDFSPSYGGNGYYKKLKIGATSEGYACLSSVYGNSRYAEYDAGHTSYSWIKTDTGVDERSFVRFGFDYESKQLFGTPLLDLSSMITDLDDAEVYGDALWEGFQTGECYLEISTDQCVAEKFNFVITKIGDEDLTKTLSVDTTPPTVTVDFGEYDGANLPEALVDCSYPVFPATATDNGAETGVSARVFYNFGQDGEYELNCFGGSFVPGQTGLYTIVYTSTDWFGNKAEKFVEVEAVASANPLVLSVDTDGAVKTGRAGIRIPVPVATYRGGVGKLTYKATASVGEKSYDVSSGSFIPMDSGVYTVTYELTDFVGQRKTVTYRIEVQDEQRPVFLDDVSFPKYFIENGDYVLPVMKAYQIHTSAEYTATATLIDGNGETVIRGSMFSPVADKDGYAVIRYSASNSAGENFVEYKIPVIGVLTKTGKYDFKKYFKGDDLTFASSQKYISVTAEEGGTKSFEFIKELLADGFYFQFGLDNANDNGNLDAVVITLTDSENPGQQISVSVKKWEDGRVYLNGVRTNAIARGLNENNAFVSFGYSESDGTYTLSGLSMDLAIESYLNGRSFEGFTSKKVYMSVTLENAEAGTIVYMQKLNNTNLTSATSDLFAPQFTIIGGYPSSVDNGETLTTLPYVAVDVYSPSVSVLMTVSDADGNVLKNSSGVALDGKIAGIYEIPVTVYGTIQIKYTFSDGNKSGTAIYSISVPDTGAPEFTFEGSIPKTMKAGETITVPAAKATDALSGECTAYVVAFDPDMMIGILNNGQTFTPTKKGVYTIKYFAYDTSGNMNIYSFDILVE